MMKRKKVTLKNLSKINSTGSFQKNFEVFVFVYNVYIYFFIKKIKAQTKKF